MRINPLVFGLGLVLHTGCLSLSTIPQEDEDASVGVDSDTGTKSARDAGSDAAPDAEVPPPEVLEEAGLQQPFVEAGLPCDACVETCEGHPCPVVKEVPGCAPGVKGECLLDTPNIAGFSVNHDWIYWIDRGTTDALNNPRNDGAIMRTRVGDWTREVLVDKLDFYNEGGRTFELTSIEAYEDVAYWRISWDRTFFIKGLQQGPRVHGALKTGQHWCFGPAAAYGYGTVNGLKHLLVDRLDGTGDHELSPTLADSNCRVVGGYLYSLDESARVPLTALATPSDVLRSGFDTLSRAYPSRGVRASGSLLFKELADDRIGMATETGTFTELQWSAITRAGRLLFADQRYVYFGGLPPTRGFFRARIDGTGSEERMAALVPGDDNLYDFTQVTSEALVWPEPWSLHVVPLAPMPQ